MKNHRSTAVGALLSLANQARVKFHPSCAHLYECQGGERHNVLFLSAAMVFVSHSVGYDVLSPQMVPLEGSRKRLAPTVFAFQKRNDVVGRDSPAIVVPCERPRRFTCFSEGPIHTRLFRDDLDSRRRRGGVDFLLTTGRG